MKHPSRVRVRRGCTATGAQQHDAQQEAHPSSASSGSDLPTRPLCRCEQHLPRGLATCRPRAEGFHPLPLLCDTRNLPCVTKQAVPNYGCYSTVVGDRRVRCRARPKTNLPTTVLVVDVFFKRRLPIRWIKPKQRYCSRSKPKRREKIAVGADGVVLALGSVKDVARAHLWHEEECSHRFW